ncbi:metallophosphoesterase [Sphingomonas sp. Leaf231]|uniref:metallophosphoesterase n=1 Tax=Sphingomonas sp. Leaf231 TaxID=1736301 RepID=UPI0012E2F027
MMLGQASSAALRVAGSRTSSPVKPPSTATIASSGTSWSIRKPVARGRPDIVLLAGDFVIGERPEGTAARALDLAPLVNLRARNGVFAVWGNHDHWTDREAIRSSLRKAGVVVLENEAVRVGAIAIVGIDDRFSHHDDVAHQRAKQKRLAVCLSPLLTLRTWPPICRRPFPYCSLAIPIVVRCFGEGITTQP